MNSEFPSNYDHIKDSLIESLLTKSFEIQTSEDDTEAQVHFTPAFEGIGNALPIFEEDDAAILLHREAHFASNFPLMLHAYEHEERAAVLDVTPEQIKKLMYIEEKLGSNLAPLVLQADDAQKIARIRKLYILLQNALSDTTNPDLALLAELILSEEEESEVVAHRIASQVTPSTIPSLIALIEHDLFYDPLWPGYGFAPCIAALVLGSCAKNTSKTKEIVSSLFSMLQHDSFEVQNASLTALRQIGPAAKDFCIKLLHARPICRNNELAALALCSFSEDPEVSKAIETELQDADAQKHASFSLYLQAYSEESL